MIEGKNYIFIFIFTSGHQYKEDVLWETNPLLIFTSILKAASKEKIVSAFKKFDRNGDGVYWMKDVKYSLNKSILSITGVIDWEEFQQVRIRSFYILYLCITLDTHLIHMAYLWLDMTRWLDLTTRPTRYKY